MECESLSSPHLKETGFPDLPKDALRHCSDFEPPPAASQTRVTWENRMRLIVREMLRFCILVDDGSLFYDERA